MAEKILQLSANVVPINFVFWSKINSFQAGVLVHCLKDRHFIWIMNVHEQTGTKEASLDNRGSTVLWLNCWFISYGQELKDTTGGIAM